MIGESVLTASNYTYSLKSLSSPLNCNGFFFPALLKYQYNEHIKLLAI